MSSEVVKNEKQKKGWYTLTPCYGATTVFGGN